MLRHDSQFRHLFDSPAPPASAEPIAAAIDVRDWKASRELFNQAIREGEKAHPTPKGVQRQSFALTTSDGARRELRWYTMPARSSDGSAILYMHGGGMYHGSVDLYDGIVGRYAELGVPLLAVDYRLAPEHPHPIPVQDCFEGLRWLSANAHSLGIDPTRIIVMGDSAGGGLAAGVSLMARDRGGPQIAKQVLIFPMLDDRTSETPDALLGLVTWDHEHNRTAWSTLLGPDVGAVTVSSYAAPARAADVTNLPDTYLEVGQLDLFCDEVISFGHRLSNSGVQVELHVRPGVPHGFDFLAPHADASRWAREDRARAILAV